MPNFQYIGRSGIFLGKSIPQICLKLKNFGIGRMFVRETYKRYPGEANISNLIKFLDDLIQKIVFS